MNDTTASQAIKDLVKSASPQAWATLVVAGIAQYGAGLYIKTLAKSLVTSGKTHHRIAFQVATWVVIWACKNWIKDAAIRATTELITAVESFIASVKSVVTT